MLYSEDSRLSLQTPGTDVPMAGLHDAHALTHNDVRAILDTCATFVDWSGADPSSKGGRPRPLLPYRLYDNANAKMPDALRALDGAR
eukprot:5496986-Lingulodinium_polyedra.AAC.1